MRDSHFVNIQSRKMTPGATLKGNFHSGYIRSHFDIKPCSRTVNTSALSLSAQSALVFAMNTLKCHIGLKAKAECRGPCRLAL